MEAESSYLPSPASFSATKTNRAIMALALVLISGLASPARSAPGEGDPEFGSCGILVEHYGYNEIIEDIAVQPDGKIIAVGMAGAIEGGGPSAPLITRWLPNGILDTTFGDQGVVIDLENQPLQPRAVAVQSDGSLIVAGGSGNEFAASRYTPTGLLDRAFGNFGLATTGTVGPATNVLIQPDGKIVASVRAAVRTPLDGIGAVRLTTIGQFDEDFGVGGIALATASGIGPAAYAEEVNLVRPDDGGIVVAGSVFGDTSSDMFLARFTSTGTVDTAFGSTGTVLADVGPDTNDVARDLALLQDDKLVVLGESDARILLVRYTTAGALDTSFGTSGTVVDDLGGFERPQALDVHDDGRLVISGEMTLGSLDYLLTARYLDNGAPDPSFGDGGYEIMTAGVPARFLAVAVEPDNKILFAGDIFFFSDHDILMMRLQGEFPTSTTGYVLDGFGGQHPFATGDDPLPACTNSAPYFGSDIARGAVVLPDSSGGFIADGSGGIHPFGVWLNDPPSTVSGTPYFGGADITRDLVLHPSGSGGYLLDGLGGIHPFSWGGDPLPTAAVGAPYFGSDIARDIVVLPDGSGGYMLDGLGGVHPFGIGSPAPPTATGLPYFGFDIARALQLNPVGPGGFILDGYGGTHPFSGATNTAEAPYFSGFDIARDITILPGGTGGYLLDGFGGIHPFKIGSGSLPPLASGVPYFGFDIARRFAVFPELVDSLGPARSQGAEGSEGKPTPRRIPPSMLIEK